MIVKIIGFYLIGYSIYVLVDIVCLRFIMPYFHHQLADILRTINGTLTLYWPSALCAWALAFGGLLFFVVFVNKQASYVNVMLRGALYGFVVYGIYEGTNYALLARWPFWFTVVDILWGTFYNAIMALFFYILAKKFLIF